MSFSACSWVIGSGTPPDEVAVALDLPIDRLAPVTHGRRRICANCFQQIRRRELVSMSGAVLTPHTCERTGEDRPYVYFCTYGCVYSRVGSGGHRPKLALSRMRTPVALPPSSQENEMHMKRLPPHTTTLEERLAQEAQRLREKAKTLPAAERERALRKARQADAASHVNDWINSPGLQPPT
jgi:hypothetical protein